LKARRPIASGALSPALAGAVGRGAGPAVAPRGRVRARNPVRAVAVTVPGVAVGLFRPIKHIVILDVLAISLGFVLRAAAGAVAIDVPISHWLLVVTILLGAVPRAQQAGIARLSWAWLWR